ncbi:MAG: hypothetical protein ACJA1F_000042 [Paracoccaceae bacterium]|jgi:hypothetical protein|tara:strand:+ start:1768 stop:2214 length:447 start_codon:yes stop_codon:yes gene_type:complete
MRSMIFLFGPNRGNAPTAKSNQMKQAAAVRAAKALDEIIAELEHIAFTGMSKFVSIDVNGQPKIDLSNCTPEDLDLLSELTPTVRSAGDTTRSSASRSSCPTDSRPSKPSESTSALVTGKPPRQGTASLRPLTALSVKEARRPSQQFC